MAARFQVLPSDYIKNHDWDNLSLDYETATVLNEIDFKKEEAKMAAMFGKKK